MKTLSILLLAILTVALCACNQSPTEPKISVYAYEGVFTSRSQKDLQGYGWKFSFQGTDCNDFQEGKLPSDKIMRAELQCEGWVPHSVDLYSAVFNPNVPGPYAHFDNVNWVFDKDEKVYKFTFEVE